MKPVRVHPAAEAEADGTFEYLWVRSESAGLGFDAELRLAFVTLRKTPQLCAPYLHGTRRVLLNRYPYFVVFREFPRKIQIVAVVQPSVALATGPAGSRSSSHPAHPATRSWSPAAGCPVLDAVSSRQEWVTTGDHKAQ